MSKCFIPKHIIDKVSGHHVHYCTVMLGGKIITTAHNKSTGFRYKGTIYSCHAECEALRKLPHNIKTKSLVLKVIGNGYTSKPCANCLEFMKNFNIRKVQYSHNGLLVTEKFADMHSDHITIHGRLMAYINDTNNAL